jgi:HD superfamily phosphohydrolase
MDPVYKEFIPVEKSSPIYRVISSRLLQRLRYLRQLGPCYLVYPGAEHTRFQHSLGVMWLVGKAVDYLRMNGFKVEEEVETALKVAALTHDLGHSPFSHALEGFILEKSHEELSLEALKWLEEEKIEKELLEEVASILKREHPHPFTYQLISSQLDCDRLDYLTRDSFYTGVAFGRIEVNRILMSALLEEGELVWSFKGFNALESYVMSRYQMYWAVYFHRGNLSAQVLLQKIVQRIRELLHEGQELPIPQELRKALKENSTEAFFNLTDGHVICAIYQLAVSEDKVLQDLCQRFVKRSLFKAVEVTPQKAIEIREKVEKAGLNPEYYFEVVEPSKVAYSYYSPDSKDLIKVKVKEGVKELSSVAPTDAIKALSRKVSKTYAVVPPEVLKQ